MIVACCKIGFLTASTARYKSLFSDFTERKVLPNLLKIQK